MQNKYDIKTIHHNRCVVIPAEQMAVAGIAKGDYVTVTVSGDEIRLKKIRLCDQHHCDEHCGGVN